jgi:hypothetical protein
MLLTGYPTKPCIFQFPLNRFSFFLFLCGVKENGNQNHELGAGFSVHKRIISAVKRVQFVADRMSYTLLRGSWCHIIVLNVHAPTEDKTDDVKGSFYEELERMFDKFPKYHTKILLGDFNAKVSRNQAKLQ